MTRIIPTGPVSHGLHAGLVIVLRIDKRGRLRWKYRPRPRSWPRLRWLIVGVLLMVGGCAGGTWL
jgi:hypothetical protein